MKTNLDMVGDSESIAIDVFAGGYLDSQLLVKKIVLCDHLVPFIL